MFKLRLMVRARVIVRVRVEVEVRVGELLPGAHAAQGAANKRLPVRETKGWFTGGVMVGVGAGVGWGWGQGWGWSQG